MKIRPDNGGCYYLDDDPDENGEYHGTNKYTDAEVRVRWDEEKGWVVVWEARMELGR